MARRDDEELEAFKREIDLRDYAAAQGYVVHRASSSRNHTAMKHPDHGDKILIGMGTDRHYVYQAIGDPFDKGSILDFVMKRQGLTLGQARKELRPWLAGAALPPSVAPARLHTGEKLEPVAKDLIAVRARYEAAEGLQNRRGYHPYLCDQRALPASLLASDRLLGRVRIDARGNALFSHHNADGLCGFEMKNEGFTSFSPGGLKGLWGSREEEDDEALVIAETAIDAISYLAVFGLERARCVSTAGAMNRSQPALLNRAIRELPPGSKVIAAVDHDEGGRKLVRSVHTDDQGIDVAFGIEPVFRHVRDTLGRTDLTFEVHHPDLPRADWNDELRRHAPLPYPAPE